jgi:DNA-directed RNA polymerase specialized sigma24 family protein
MTDSEPNDLAGGFPDTHWTSIFRASNLDQTVGREALGRVVGKYRKPVLAHIKWRFAVDQSQAEDWFHSFVEKKILEHHFLKSAQKERGRSFRGFLRKSIDNFIIDEIRHDNRARHKPEGGFLPLDELAERAAASAAPVADPYDLAWAQDVLRQAEEQLREFYVTKGREDYWNIFNEGFLQPTCNQTNPPSMAELARRFGFQSAEQASNGLVTAKRKFKQLLRTVVSEFAEDEDAVDAEIRELTAILANAG